VPALEVGWSLTLEYPIDTAGCLPELDYALDAYDISPPTTTKPRKE
jgi:hypothetical protein